MINTTRHSGLFPIDAIKGATVCIVGVGGIGSHTAECLVKLGVENLRIVDFDDVDEVNVANQGYRVIDIGKTKVAALKERLDQACGISITAECKKVDASELFMEDFVVSAVDSMTVRKMLWESFLRSPSRYFIDGRMGARYGEVYFVDSSNEAHVAAYAKTLFSDEDAAVLPCTEKATIFCGSGIGALITGVFAKALKGDNINYYVEMDWANMQLVKNIWATKE